VTSTSIDSFYKFEQLEVKRILYITSIVLILHMFPSYLALMVTLSLVVIRVIRDRSLCVVVNDNKTELGELNPSGGRDDSAVR
jgi:hypothetical protein